MNGIEGTKSVRWLVCLGLPGAPVYAVNFGLSELLHRAGIASPGNDYTSFLWQFLFLAVLYLIALRVVFRTRSEGAHGGGTFLIILFFALLYLLVPTFPVLHVRDLSRRFEYEPEIGGDFSGPSFQDRCLWHAIERVVDLNRSKTLGVVMEHPHLG